MENVQMPFDPLNPFDFAQGLQSFGFAQDLQQARDFQQAHGLRPKVKTTS